jgi:hypothetical protein
MSEDRMKVLSNPLDIISGHSQGGKFKVGTIL